MGKKWSHTQAPFAVTLAQPDGLVTHTEIVHNPSKWLYDSMKDHFRLLPSGNPDEMDVFVIPVADARWKRERPWVPLACAYSATKACCSNLHGMSFDLTDEEWFLDHGLMQPGGLPMHHTLRVVQELLSPYGMRINRVRIKPGYALNGGLTEWRDHLGINPIGRLDMTTSNAEYAAMTGLNPADVAEQYRLEYSDVPFAGGVVCEASAVSEHGHASYAAPRRKTTGNEIISYTIARVAHDPWPKGEPKWEPIIREEVDVLDVWAIVDSKRKPVGFLGAKVKDTKLVTSGSVVTGRPSDTMVKELCMACGQSTAEKDMDICYPCWDKIWSGYECPTCKVSFSTKPVYFLNISLQKKRIEGVCAQCTQEVWLWAKDTLEVQQLIEAMKVGNAAEIERERIGFGDAGWME